MQPGAGIWALRGNRRGERRAATLPSVCQQRAWGEGYSAESFFSAWEPPHQQPPQGGGRGGCHIGYASLEIPEFLRLSFSHFLQLLGANPRGNRGMDKLTSYRPLFHQNSESSPDHQRQMQRQLAGKFAVT